MISVESAIHVATRHEEDRVGTVIGSRRPILVGTPAELGVRHHDHLVGYFLGLEVGDEGRDRAGKIAHQLGMSGTTLRRRLKADHTSYQFLLDRARQYRCEQMIKETWMPGKCVAYKLGYVEVNSFYRAFRRWTGLSYSQYKLQYN